MRILVISSNPGRATPVIRRFIESGRTVTSLWTTNPATDWDKTLFPSGFQIVQVAKKPVEAELMARAADEKPDLIAVVGFTSILPVKLLEFPKHGTINTHAGALPKYRGGSPLNWQIIKGEKEIGISLIRLNRSEDGQRLTSEERLPIDGGPLLAFGKFPLEDSDDIASVHEKANRMFPELMLKVVDQIEAGTLKEIIQSEVEAGYWHQRQRSDGRIQWGRSTAEQIHNFVRALTKPYPGAYSMLDGTEIVIYKTEIPKMKINGTAGRVLFLQGDGPFVVCGDSALRVVDYKITDGRKLRHGDLLS